MSLKTSIKIKNEKKALKVISAYNKLLVDTF